MKALEVPIVLFPQSSLELIEKKEQRIINKLAKFNLRRLRKEKKDLNLFYIRTDIIYYR